MTAGQRAMAVAIIYPEPQKLKRAGSSVAEQQTVTRERLSLARAVLAYSRETGDRTRRPTSCRPT